MGNSSSSSSPTSEKANERPPSRSRCTVQRFATTHDFQLPNYRRLLDAAAGMDARWYRKSGAFSVGGHSWNIRFYPNGDTGYTSVFLSFLGVGSGMPDASTRFSINVVEKAGQPKLTDFPVLNWTFSPHEFEAGYPLFFKNSDLVPSSHLDDDGCLTVRCVITVIKESRTKLKKRGFMAPPRPDFQDHLAKMLKDGERADVTFNVGGQLFRAHRCLLAARSPVFRAELFGPLKEEESRCIQIDDMEPSVFQALLHFLYTDCMMGGYKQGKTENLQHLMVAADRYGVDRLKVMCEGALCGSIKTKTVATTLVLAEQHDCRALKKACTEFIMASENRLSAVMETDGFSHLLATCPHLMSARARRQSHDLFSQSSSEVLNL